MVLPTFNNVQKNNAKPNVKIIPEVIKIFFHFLIFFFIRFSLSPPLPYSPSQASYP